MLWGVDCSTPPTAEEAANLFNARWQFMGGYIGGNTPRVWTPDEWSYVFRAGLELVPIWVAPFDAESDYMLGRTHGQEAVAAMQASRLTGMVTLDVENGLEPGDYARGFVGACNDAQIDVTIYGTEKTIRALQTIRWRQWWLAKWAPVPPPLSNAPIDWSMWQFQAGLRFDIDIATDAFQFAGFQT